MTTIDIEKSLEEINNLSENNDHNEVINKITDNFLERIPKNENEKIAKLYIRRGNSWYYKKSYDKAISDYSKAIEIKNDYALAYYCRATTRGPKKDDYSGALEDYNRSIAIDPTCEDFYVGRGTAFRQLKEYSKAVADCSTAISINNSCAEAYYNRGLAIILSNKDIIKAKEDFEKYLELAASENDVWSQYAKYNIKEIEERSSSDDIFYIANLIDEIKSALRVNEASVTHYTSLSALSNLILENSKFRITEGNFLNDPSEGSIFFDFLGYKTSDTINNNLCSGCFSTKPFIGSFVSNNNSDKLIMWRSYGKEGDVEAKGCAITLSAQEFIEATNDCLSQVNDFTKYESDIGFYMVAYLNKDTNDIHTYDENTSIKLKNLMMDLKEKISLCNSNDKFFLEKRLNRIAFLFKNDVFKYENEIRMIVNGLGFTKKFMTNTIPPRVYIELNSIKQLVNKITLGPKVDSLERWIYVFHYGCENNPPEIIKSSIPFR